MYKESTLLPVYDDDTLDVGLIDVSYHYYCGMLRAFYTDPE